ncbi:hypothetical protein D3C76_1563350 [compost metagenome]
MMKPLEVGPMGTVPDQVKVADACSAAETVPATPIAPITMAINIVSFISSLTL